MADPGNHLVQVLDAEFKHIFNINKNGSGRELRWPDRVAVNKSGEILISDYTANTVSVYSQTGSYSRQLPGPWNKPSGISVDSDDTIYVCDGGSYTVKVLGRAGQIIRTFGGHGTQPGQFHDIPWFITVYKESIVVSDVAGKIHQFTKSGSYIRQMDVNNVRDASGLTVTADNDLAIAYIQGPMRMVRGEQTVSVIGERGSEPWQLNHPLGVAVSKTGQIIMANQGNHNLLVYDLGRKIFEVTVISTPANKQTWCYGNMLLWLTDCISWARAGFSVTSFIRQAYRFIFLVLILCIFVTFLLG